MMQAGSEFTLNRFQYTIFRRQQTAAFVNREP
jgi:hypothetical protein